MPTGEETHAASRPAPAGFADLAQALPRLHLDIRYYTSANFFGSRLPGYGAPGAWLLKAAAEALALALASLEKDGLGLVVFDAYRPQRASRAMVAWAESHDRRDLLQGFISRESRHNRGTAIDVGLISAATRMPLDMGSDFDAFDGTGETLSASGHPLQNRLILARAMKAAGFQPYWREWWHFELPVEGAAGLDVPYGSDEP